MDQLSEIRMGDTILEVKNLTTVFETREGAPIVLVGTAPNILAVNDKLPVRSFGELIDHVRARPGQLNYASVGNGSASHLAMELLKHMGGLYVVHIPYNGAPPAVQAAAAGDVQMIMSNPTAA